VIDAYFREYTRLLPENKRKPLKAKNPKEDISCDELTEHDTALLTLFLNLKSQKG
jgi:hypothetical protein